MSLGRLDVLAKPRISQEISLAPAFLGCTLLAFFLIVMLVISFSVPGIDDYSRAGDAATAGLLRSVHAEYIGWSGRFLSTTLEYALSYVIGTDYVYPCILALVWLLSGYLIYFSIRAIFEVRRTTAIALAAALEMQRWSLLAGPSESFFWLTGAIENYLSVSVFTFLWSLALRLQTGPSPPSSAVVAALASASFLAAGLHELYATVFIVSLAMVTGAICIRTRSIRVWPLLILGAAVLGLLVVVAAPGNAARASFFPKDFDRASAILTAAQYVLPRVAKFSSVLVVATGLLLFSLQKRIAVNAGIDDTLSAPWIALFALGCVVAMFAAPIVIMAAIPLRTVDGIIFFALASAYLCVGLLFHGNARGGWWQPSMALQSGLAALFCVAVLSTSNIRWALRDAVYASSAFRQEHAARLDLLRSVAGQHDARVEFAPFTIRPRTTFAADVSVDSTRSTNVGIAKYYGIAEVRLGRKNSVTFGTKKSGAEQ